MGECEKVGECYGFKQKGVVKLGPRFLIPCMKKNGFLWDPVEVGLMTL